MYSIFCSIGDITSTIYEIKPLFLWHHTHYIYHHINAISFPTWTVLMISQQLYLWDLIRYICQHHIHRIVYNSLLTVFVPSQPLYLCFPLTQWYHTLFIYDIARTIWKTSDTLYKVSHPQFMTSRHIIDDITCVVFMSSLPRYLTLHPEYLSPHNHSKYDLWTTVCMTSHPLIYDLLCTRDNMTSTL